MPYILIGLLLIITRLTPLKIAPILKSIKIEWANILNTDMNGSILPLYNPGIFPFLFIAILLPFFYKLDLKTVKRSFTDTFKTITPAAIALVFTLGMVQIMLNSGGASNSDSMLIVMAKSMADITGKLWVFIAPWHFRIPLTLPAGYAAGALVILAVVIRLESEIYRRR